MTRQNPQRARLVQARPLNRQVKHYVFESLDRGRFDFKPGQFICLAKSFQGKKLERCYSLASAPTKANRFELCLNPVRDRSAFGHHLSMMEPGHEIDYRGPEGNFQLNSPLRESVFVASGTGIAPIRSMLHYLLGESRGRSRDVPLTLIFGARSTDGLLFRTEFEALEAEHRSFRFWPTLSRPSNGWRGRKGYVQSHLEAAVQGRTKQIDVYLCGHLAMIEEVRRRLLEAGFDDKAVIYEKYG